MRKGTPNDGEGTAREKSLSPKRGELAMVLRNLTDLIKGVQSRNRGKRVSV